MKNLSEIGAWRRIKSLTVVVVLAAVLFACKKETGEEVSVEIQSPASGAIYQSGDTFQLKVYARDNADLHEMSLEIKQGANIMLGMYPYVHATLTHTIDTQIIVPNVVTATTVALEAKARDHDGHSAAETINITFNP